MLYKWITLVTTVTVFQCWDRIVNSILKRFRGSLRSTEVGGVPTPDFLKNSDTESDPTSTSICSGPGVTVNLDVTLREPIDLRSFF